ncbi:glycosyl hydrolase [Haliea sp. E17]|uniref:glycosyl hydrolase n=1 Tax=Haliea sp. E17 TaxID=3401576 RepID=UPI003AB0DB90
MVDTNFKRITFLVMALVVGGSGTFSAPAISASDALTLEQGFEEPPNVARPRVWWHWLNGNITAEGIRKDLEWMQRSGIGGLTNFDVNFAVPSIVDKPIPYMSGEWKEVYRYSVSLADQLGLEFGIAASPGWSETGGPWVKPRDGMKKLVWSETYVEGGKAFDSVLAKPPTTTGPYQDLAPPKDLNPTPKSADPVFYADVAVLAYRAQEPVVPGQVSIALADGTGLNSSVLTDNKFRDGVDIPKPTAESPTQLDIDFASEQTFRSATLFLPGQADIYSGPKYTAELEMLGREGAWQTVGSFQLSTVPTTIAFEEVTGQKFRVVLTQVAGELSNSGDSAPGFDARYMDAIAAYMEGGKTMALSELHLSPDVRVHQYEAKAGFTVAPDYYALQPALTPLTAPDLPVKPDAVLDLTSQLQPDGSLYWTPPAGHWKILRLGYSLLGKTNHPAVPEATGLEVDKLDAGAVRRYLETYLQNYRDAVGDDLVGKRGISAILTDSTEVGAFNWTPAMLDQFQRLRGYSALPWLPTLTGEVIGSREQSDRFLYDFRRTIADLHASEHYGTIAKVAHENELKVYGEALEGWRPSLGDDMDMRRYTDYPMSAVWSYNREDGAKPLYIADMRGAASVAHLYGQNLAAAESMTSTRHPWDHVPADLRRVVDLEFLQGINRVVIHSSVHQPLDDKQPGLSLRHIGQFFNRHIAWAEMARPWMDYIARSSFLLQQGRFVADVAYFYGEEAPLGELVWNGYLKDVPEHYGYDFINPPALLNLLEVRDGRLVTDTGASYAALYLGGTSQHMTLPVLRRLSQLVEEGATIVGNAPVASPDLTDDRAEYQKLAARLWPGDAVTRVGKGRVFVQGNVEDVLSSIGVRPDVEFSGGDADTELPFLHRKLGHGDIYFVSNRKNRPESVEAHFRVTGKAAQIWRADSGEITPASYRIGDGETIVPLKFDAEESYFVTFLEDTRNASRTIPEPDYKPVLSVSGPWSIQFQPGRGAPSSTEMDTLSPLNENEVPGIRYFSGVASYTTAIELPATYTSGSATLLDLGDVGDLAEVWINGQKVGTLWHKPFRIDISSTVKIGENQLKVRVANRWVNRLIGDAQPEAEKIAFTVTPTYEADAPLRPAGLIGPVRVLARDGE